MRDKMIDLIGWWVGGAIVIPIRVFFLIYFWMIMTEVMMRFESVDA